MQWHTIAALTLMIVLLTIYICLTTQKCTIFKKRLYSNTVTVMLFFSDVKQYIPVKLCKTVGSIHLFQIYGQLFSNQITLERRYLWNVIRIDWGEVFVTLNGPIIQMPILVKVPLRDKYRLRSLMREGSLLLHVMVRQGMSWYALDNVEYLLPPQHLEESEIGISEMASEMTISQHICKGLLRIILPEDAVTVDMEVMTLKGIYIFRQDKHSNEDLYFLE